MKNISFGLIAASALVVGFAGQTNFASAQQLKSQGWYKACSDQGKSKICNVQYQAVASTGQVVTSINLAEISGEVERRVFQVTVPTDRRVPPGIEVIVDDKEPTVIPFTFCTNSICAAEVKLDDKLIGVLKGGSKMSITSTNYQGAKSPIDVPLTGFPEAYDGPPIQQEALEAKQKQLQEELNEKAKTLAEKLQEAQDKAKQSAN